MRDLGVAPSFARLVELTISDCSIIDLDGIEQFSSLKSLDVSCNRLDSVEPLSFHQHLQYLDLSANRLSSLDSLSSLETCPKLSQLICRHNPLERRRHYRRLICSTLTQLSQFDRSAVTDHDRIEVPAREAALLCEREPSPEPQQQPFHSLARSSSSASLSSRPGTARPMTAAARPGTSSSLLRPTTSLTPWDPTASRPSTAKLIDFMQSSVVQVDLDSVQRSASSLSLTEHGDALQGSLLSLRRRQKKSGVQ